MDQSPKPFSLDLSTVNEGWRYYTQFCCRRLIVAFMIIVLVFIPGACGESVSIGCGSSIAVSGGSSAEGILASDGSATQSSLSSVGVIDDLNIDPWVKNTKGDYAEIGVTGTNIAGFTYSDNYYPIKNSVGVSDAVWAQQWMGASSADSLHAYARASNSAGDSAGADLDLKYGSLDGYYNAAYSGAAPWLGMDRIASVQQTLDSAKGNEILATTWAVDPIGDAAGASTSVKQGTLYGYSVLANAAQYSNRLKATGVSVYSLSASAPSGSILNVMNTYDSKGDLSIGSTSITNGNLVGNSLAYSISQWGFTESNQNINAKGSVIDVGAYAQNNKPGYEYLSSSDGTVKYITAPNGIAKFQFKTHGELTTNVNSKATTYNVLITPTLPVGTKTAIMLEPMYYTATSIGATDLGPTVGRTLVGKEYAVLGYRDSGASIDKFQDLDNYNIALINSHMDNQHISLSTSPESIDANQLGAWYSNPPSKSLVILAGCKSLEGSPSYYSPLAKAVSEADAGMGFPDNVGVLWCSDYLSEFFKKMSEGQTAKQANEYVWNSYRPTWIATHPGCSLQLVIPMNGFGNGDFKLL